MKSFIQFIREKIEIPEAPPKMGFARKDMPQIPEKNHEDFFRYLKSKHSVSTTKETVVTDTLKPSQKHFNKEKILGLMDAIQKGSYKQKRILVSKDNYVIDGHHTWIANINLDIPDTAVVRIDVAAKRLFDLMHEYPNSFTKNLSESECQIITRKHMKEFEILVDRLFKKFNMDFDFTKHFRERMSDGRNDPCIDMKELAAVIKKIYGRQGKSLKSIAGVEAVIKDMQSDLNIPVAVEYDRRKDEFRVAMKTVMRKKNFRTPNKVIRY